MCRPNRDPVSLSSRIDLDSSKDPYAYLSSVRARTSRAERTDGTDAAGLLGEAEHGEERSDEQKVVSYSAMRAHSR